MTRNRLILWAATAAVLSRSAAGWAADSPRFDAVALHLQRDHEMLSLEQFSANGTHISRGSVDFVRVPMLSMIRSAYGVEEFQIRHAAWMESKYSGRATFPAERPADQVPDMLRAMLEERFGLRGHIEKRVAKVWLLEQAPGGTKLAEPSGKPLGVPGMPLGWSQVAPGQAKRRGNANPEIEWLVMSKGTMRIFSILLSKEAKRPVLDRTGLTGEYDVNVEVANAYPRKIPPPSMTPPVAVILDPPLVLGPALKKLGLKFRESREAVEFMIIDAVPSLTPK